MFSKALFKQSCKANGVMWAVVTFAVCFMLACVMFISGGGNISGMKNAIQDAIIVGEINAQMEYRSLNYYKLAQDGLAQFDSLFSKNYVVATTYGAEFDTWLQQIPNREDYSSDEEYNQAVLTWQIDMPIASELAEQVYAKNYNDWQENMPQRIDYDNDQTYQVALQEWNKNKPTGTNGAITSAFTVSVLQLQQYVLDNALKLDSSYTQDSAEAKEMLGAVMYTLNPNGNFDEFYTSHQEEIPQDYDITNLIINISNPDYLTSTERVGYILERAKYCSPIFIAGNMTNEENVVVMLEQLAKYGVTKQKYESFGYTYDSIKNTGVTTIITYQTRYEYELEQLQQKYMSGEFESEEEFKQAVLDMDTQLTGDLSSSLLSTLPQSVSDALEEVGQMDMYGIIVGSIFFKMAGLLLPIIYMIMVSNNLIAGQVDSGSMAYVLSTSIKRKQVVFTQAVYLVGSLFAMFCLSTITSVVCLAVINNADITLTYGKLILLNLGAFIAMFAMSGICFFTSCWFDRSKYSMSIGGGISMFFLVATMLGLFGSTIMPSVIRLDSLNNFNYVTIISLFDTISILDGTPSFIWKLAILVVIGLVGFVAGSIKFKKKDLPL